MESPDSPRQLSDASYIQSPEVTQRWLMWSLIWFGVLLVLLAGPIGRLLVTTAGGPGAGGWNPDEAREAALNVRLAGAMSFAFGLVERIVIEIAKLKPGAL